MYSYKIMADDSNAIAYQIQQPKTVQMHISEDITLKINYELLNHIFFYCTQRRERPNIIFIHAYQHIASKNS